MRIGPPISAPYSRMNRVLFVSNPCRFASSGVFVACQLSEAYRNRAEPLRSFVPRFVTTLIVVPGVCRSRSEPPVET